MVFTKFLILFWIVKVALQGVAELKKKMIKMYTALKKC